MKQQMSISKLEWCALHHLLCAFHKDPCGLVNTAVLLKQIVINRNRMASIFRYVYHCRIGEYRQHKKFEHSRYLLSLGNENLKQIAASCGYSSPQNFNSAFKKYHGITPHVFLQGLKQFTTDKTCHACQ